MKTTAEKVTHTPGPWTVNVISVQTVQKTAMLAEKMSPHYKVTGSDPNQVWFDEPEVKANARLIAAAPRLEEFLRYGVCGFCPSCGCNVGNTAGCDWCNWIQNGRALLAEINGETYQRPPMLPADEINKRNQAFKVS